MKIAICKTKEKKTELKASGSFRGVILEENQNLFKGLSTRGRPTPLEILCFEGSELSKGITDNLVSGFSVSIIKS